jgi:hypothetical protein
MQYEPVVGFMNQCGGNIFYQLFFGRQGGGGAVCKSQPGTYPEYMGIHRHIGLLVNNAGYHIGCFAAYAWQFYQLFHRHRYMGPMLLHQHIGHTYQVFGFIVGVADAAYQGKKVVESGRCKGLWGRVLLKNGWRGHIHPLVGTLG